MVTFTALAPGLRESDRRVFLKCLAVGEDSWLVFVAGTTLVLFGKQQATLRRVVDSLQILSAPATRLR
jgi:hypothetical protein